MSEFYVLTGNFEDVIKSAPKADINIFGMAHELSLDFMHNVPKSTKSSCLFIGDSGRESAIV